MVWCLLHNNIPSVKCSHGVVLMAFLACEMVTWCGVRNIISSVVHIRRHSKMAP